MTSPPPITPEVFRRRLEEVSPEPLSATAVDAMLLHYDELRAWNRLLSLIGPGTVEEVITRHFGEALAALPLVPVEPPGAGHLIDVGSGAGFPGLVLAAARPSWRFTLIEAQQRKWSFLMTVARKASLPVRCLNARVAVPLAAEIPAEIDRLTVRAVRLPATTTSGLLDRLGPEGSALYWSGTADPQVPSGYGATADRPLVGSERRRIVEVRRLRGGPGENG